MVEFDNHVTRSIFLRFVGPLFPVWLFGAVFVILLDRLSLGGPSLNDRDLGLLLGIYSILVSGLVSVLYYAEWRRSPTRVTLSFEGVSGQVGGGTRPPIIFPYNSIVRVHPPGFFTARVEAKPEGRPIDWMNLTPENALRLAEAWSAWRERQLGNSPT
ncbi:MAG: hypothetical protein L3K17_08275 [Thermoplasmata archaeon]|nr:hypothetical protein [Thermoplasmata archaeon]